MLQPGHGLVQVMVRQSYRVVQETCHVSNSVTDSMVTHGCRTSPQTVLTYCTTGVLLRTLAGDGLAGDVSHLNLDEVHERQQNTDYLLIAVRQILEHHSDLKVCLCGSVQTQTGPLPGYPDVRHDGRQPGDLYELLRKVRCWTRSHSFATA